MAIVNHDYKELELLERMITHPDGTPLRGEIDMYRRIYEDCEADEQHTWHFWHDLRLNLPIGKQSEIQIDFFLVCEEGAIVVEVKGGKIEIRNGIYYFSSGEGRIMERSPFEQAQDYVYALINGKLFNTSELFIDSVCAFPHTKMNSTNEFSQIDNGYKLWSGIRQEDTKKSFAEFCLSVIRTDKKKKNWRGKAFSKDELCIAIRALTPNICGDYEYKEGRLSSIAKWLHVQNLDLFKSLERNTRIIMEGGPGTGKTTFAKAFIHRYESLHGVYLCWNKLLAAKVKNELEKENLTNCEVKQYISFLYGLDKNHRFISFEDFQGDIDTLSKNIDSLMQFLRTQDEFKPYDYIIIDEAQDIFDKNAATVLNYMSSITANGLEVGRYLVFYDTEQGYRSEIRQLESYADALIQKGCHFMLNENKRVPTNKEIVDFANKILQADSNERINALLADIESENNALSIHRFNGTKSVIKYIRNTILGIEQQGLNWHDYVLLIDSNTKKQECGSEETIYDRICDLERIKELTVDNIADDSTRLQFSTILSYKGLENKHILLLTNSRNNFDQFELYIGLTRAIYDVEILILE